VAAENGIEQLREERKTYLKKGEKEAELARKKNVTTEVGSGKRRDREDSEFSEPQELDGTRGCASKNQAIHQKKTPRGKDK